MERAGSETVGPVAVVAAAAAEVGLERGTRPDIVVPNGWNNGLFNGTSREVNRKEANLKAEDFHLHHLHL